MLYWCVITLSVEKWKLITVDVIIAFDYAALGAP